MIPTEPTQKTLSVGATLTLTIEDIAFGGEGVARSDAFVIFVPFVLVGEDVEVEITELKRHFGRGRLIRVIRASPHRVPPECRYFGECGGCQYQHMAYAQQLETKRKQVIDLFARIAGHHGTRVDPVIPCSQPYGYRNRIMVRSQWDKTKQGLNIGFIRADNRLVIDVEECRITEPDLHAELLHVRKNPPPKGGIKVTIRKFPENWELPRDSFFQNNFYQIDALIETVGQALKSSGIRNLIDAYCGVGFFSIALADRVDRFVGVELDKRAIQAARNNAQSRGLTNGEYLAGDTETLLPELLDRFPSAETALVLDPPRKGCTKETIDLIRRELPQQIIYVSCNPATLARDIALLCDEGVYQLERVTPLDMFPQTQHVECVADLRHRAN